MTSPRTTPPPPLKTSAIFIPRQNWKKSLESDRKDRAKLLLCLSLLTAIGGYFLFDIFSYFSYAFALVFFIGSVLLFAFSGRSRKKLYRALSLHIRRRHLRS